MKVESSFRVILPQLKHTSVKLLDCSASNLHFKDISFFTYLHKNINSLLVKNVKNYKETTKKKAIIRKF